MNLKQAGRISRALSDAKRIRIIKEVKKRKAVLYKFEINKHLERAQPSIFYHLKILTDTEILLTEKEGTHVKYTINSKMIDEYIDFLMSFNPA